MAAVVLLCAGLLGLSSPDPSEYQAAAARAGRDAGAHLKLAVWCEAHGMDAERLKHLAEAIAIDPANAAARGLMGLVAHGGKWLPPEKVAESVKADEALAAKLAEYEAKRQATPETAEAHWRLALWCDQNGLQAEATVHFSVVTQIDPKRADAWHKLGCEFSHGRWINKEQAAAERAEDQAQWAADMHWEPILRQWKNDLSAGGQRRERAVAALNEIVDPRAVRSIHKVLAQGNRAQQEMAALMFSRIQCPASSHALAGLAVFDSWPDGRSFAIRELKRRDPREFMDDMIGWMHRPYEYHVTPVGPQGQPARLVIDGDRTQMNRVYRVPGMVAPNPPRPVDPPALAGAPRMAIGPIGPAGINPFFPGGPPARFGAMVPVSPQTDLTMRALGATQQTLQRDIAVVDRFNARLQATNRNVGAALAEITGESLDDDPDAWHKWWNKKLGLTYERSEPTSRATTVQYVPVRFQVHHACFAAGTPVSTLTGPRPIESLAVGDQVLSQDTVSGVLSYRPIVGIHHNPPAETVRIRLRDETIVSTPVHRFWRPGRGWAMARDLCPGEFIRTAGGRAEVVEIKPDLVQPVYNLDVAPTHSFFVGCGKVLVRDNSLPPLMFTPFDAEPSLAAIAEETTGPSEKRDGGVSPSRPGAGVSEPGWNWDSAGVSSARPAASQPGPRATEPGSTGDSPGGSSARPRRSVLGPRTVEPSKGSPR
jgi:hypothetical protein